jgi:hypothetical protein
MEHTYIVNVSVLSLRSGQVVHLDPDQWPDWIFDRKYVTPAQPLVDTLDPEVVAEYSSQWARADEPARRFDTSFDERTLGL